MATTTTAASQNSTEARSTAGRANSQETPLPPKATPAHRSPTPPSHNIDSAIPTNPIQNKAIVSILRSQKDGRRVVFRKGHNCGFTELQHLLGVRRIIKKSSVMGVTELQ